MNSDSDRIHDLIASRKSIRAFSNKAIDDKNLIKLFEAARWASSSRNEQPWRFIAARREEKDNFEKTLECLNESNRVWAQNGAILIVVLAKKNFTLHPAPNTHAQHDVGLAIGNLALQATALGIYLRQMGGINYQKVREVFEIPDEFEIISIIVGGFPGDHDSLPENLRERESMPRQRKALKEFVFEGKFGHENHVFGKAHQT
jgi:nitroreductase